MAKQIKEEPKKLNKNKLESLETVNKSLELIIPLLEANKIDNGSKLLVTKVFFEKAEIDLPVKEL